MMEVHYIEQRTPEWYAVRAGLPTASEFKKLVTPTGKPSTQYKGLACTLANEVFLKKSDPDGFEGNAWTDRGAELEERALAWYQLEYGVEVKACGFITNERSRWKAGCSPDALVGDDGMVEVKCLKAENHTAALVKLPADYKPQTQGQIILAEREWCDLLFYHPDLPPFVVRQFLDSDFADLLDKQLAAVWEERGKMLNALKSAEGNPRIGELEDA